MHDEKSTATKFVALSSSNAAKMLNVWPQKGRIEAEADADIVVWNPNNVRNVKSKLDETESNADINVLEGLTLHGAPEFVISNGRVVLYQYEMNPTVGPVGAKILNPEAYPSIFYDQVQDLDELGKVNGVDRETVKDENDQNDEDRVDENFGLTTPRKSSEPPVLNKRLGIYQRPISAHGVRNQQDSTFSLAGGYNNEDGGFGSPKRAVKINAPPGGSSRAFW